MALIENDVRRYNENTALLADNKVTRVAKIGDNVVGQQQHHTVKIAHVGRVVVAPSTLYGETNFYIEQSREYFPRSAMYKFCNFPGFTYIMTMACLNMFAAMITVAVLLGVMYPDYKSMSACLGLSIVAMVCCVPFYCIFYQHCCVVCCTMPSVLSQPVRAGLRNKNEHIEVAMNCEEALFLRGKGGTVGMTAQTSDKVRIQVLSERAVAKMRCARCFSTCCCLSACLLALWVPTMLALSIVYFTRAAEETST